MENPASKFVRDHKIEHQSIKAGLTAQPKLCLFLAMSAFKIMGKYDAQLREFETKPKADKTFANFRPFIVNKYAKHHKPNKTTVKYVGFSIANAVTTEKVDTEANMANTLWAIAEVNNALHAAQDKQTEKMMQMFQNLVTNNATRQFSSACARPSCAQTTIQTVQTLWFTSHQAQGMFRNRSQCV